MPQRRRVIAGSTAFYLTKPKNIIEQCDEAHARNMSKTAHGGFNINQKPYDQPNFKSRGGAFGTSSSVGRERLLSAE
jgi:hypothetical protein